MLGVILRIQILNLDFTIWLKSLWPFLICGKVIFTIKSLMSLDTVLQFELDLGVVGAEFEGHFVYKLRGQCKMTPPLQVLEALMLEPILAALEELGDHLAHIVRLTLVHDILNDGFLHVVSHQSKWFGTRWRRYLLDEVIPELVLDAGLLQEDCLGSHIEDTTILLTYCNRHFQCETNQQSNGMKVITYQYAKG